MVNGKSRMYANTNSRKYFQTWIYADLHWFLGSYCFNPRSSLESAVNQDNTVQDISRPRNQDAV